ncbi:MAG: hypothetical protein IH997_06640 [Proteobacteria bacterium]|nr:hypothetical protein [Pseudomonadota bacterium]
MSVHTIDLQFHHRRSLCIDAFVAIEQKIAVINARLCPGHETELFSQKIARLKAIAASPAYSKQQRSAVQSALAEIEVLLPLRHDLVHGSLSIFKSDGVALAAFVNVRETIKLGAMGRLFTAATLDELAAQALSLAAELDLAVKPPRPQKGEVASAS